MAVKALFDCGSQQTYIANRLVKLLNLKPVRDINMQVKTFGADPQNLRAKEYLIKLQSSTGDVIPIQAIGVPKICDKISGQIVKKAVKRHPFMQMLKLANDGTHPDIDIELLLGADVYWQLISWEIRKDDASGLVAINSKVGWLLNDPIPHFDASTNLIASDFTVMKLEATVTEDKILAILGPGHTWNKGS